MAGKKIVPCHVWERNFVLEGNWKDNEGLSFSIEVALKSSLPHRSYLVVFICSCHLLVPMLLSALPPQTFLARGKLPRPLKDTLGCGIDKPLTSFTGT